MRFPILICFGLIMLTGCSGQPESLEQQKSRLQKFQQERQALEDKIRKLKKAIGRKDSGREGQKHQLVNLSRIEKQPSKHYVTLKGQARTDNNVAISPKRSGRIEHIYCEEGDQVGKGELLVDLDSETIQRNIDQIKTNLAHARNLYRRQKNLWEKEIGSEVQYLNAKNRVENLEKELRAAESRLANTAIRAPISGKVDAIFMNPGEMASPASPLVRIVNLARMEVTASPAERYLDDIRPGDSVKVAFPNLGIERTRPVSHVSSFIDPDSRTFEITIKLANPQKLIRPNVLAQVKFTDYQNKAATVIPTKLLQSDGGANYVYTARPSNGHYRVYKSMIKTGRTYQGVTEVKAGLSPGERLVIDGFRKVSDREMVRTPQ